MKKMVWILILVLTLGLVGCESKDTKAVSTELTNPSVEEKAKTKQEIDNSIMQLGKLVDEKSYEQAKVLLTQLGSKALDETQKSNVDRLKGRIDLEVAKVAKETIKQEFKKKLDSIELGMADLNKKESSGITLDMREAANEKYKRWDKALNEIYQALKTQLSPEDMKKLQNEQIQWISDRDTKAQEASLEMEGGTMAPVLYAYSLSETTKKRCYELIEKYM